MLLWSLQTVASVKSRQLPRPHKFKLDGFALPPLKALGTTDLQKTAFYGSVLRCQNCCFPAISVPDYSLWGRGVIYECYELSKMARFLNRALSHVSQIPPSALLGLLPYLPRNTRHDYRPEFWSVHGTFIHFPSHFLTSSHLLWTPDNSNTFFDFSRRFELSRVESTVVYLWVSLQNVHWRISHLYKRYNNTHLPKFFFKFFSPENSFKYNSTACVNF